MLNLFQCRDAKLEAIPDPTLFKTPLGDVCLEATVDGTMLTQEPPTETYHLPSGAWVTCWHRPEFDLELLTSRLIFPTGWSASPGADLLDCWAGLWRLRANASIKSCLFTSSWAEGYRWKESDTNSGEWLYARVWHDDLTEVSLGTEDEDALKSRAHRTDGLPPEWEPYFSSSLSNLEWTWRKIDFWQHPSHQELGDRGLSLPLPSLKTGQQCQVHFAAAWSLYVEGGVTTWLAVDTSAKNILASAGCT